MAMRHTPRQSERERDVRLHDVHPHAHVLGPPGGHGPGHPPPHMNGGMPTPGALVNGPPHPAHQMVSPTVVPAPANGGQPVPPSIQKLASANEQTWLLIGRVAEQMGDLEHALSAYENALRHNPMSLSGLTQVAGIARIKENYPKAVEFFQRALTIQQDNGEVWSALGHCYLMQDDLQKAYAAYQQALYLLPNPKEDPKLWYGIGILYDRYGSLDHAEEAFASVLRMDKGMEFDKANEILFRLGIIYKQQAKYDDSLDCFDKILRNPPSPLAHADIWFQIGHVYEQQKDFMRAKDAYERVVAENPNHAKVLQQLGWLYHQDGSSFQNQDLAIQYLTKSLEADPSDAQSWYLLGRAYMAGQKYNKAYEAYQQAVYREGRNPTFWCSIGVLYFQINQYRDALDAYSRAIRINPYISEVWFDLGSLYESCNNQISDAIDAYARAAELDPNNGVIRQRLELLRNAKATGNPLPAAPGPQDVHPTAYASAVVPPPGPPMLLQAGPGGARPLFRPDSRGPMEGGTLLPLPQAPMQGRNSPGPFRGGPPPPVILDESRTPHGPNTLAPMEVDRPPIARHPTGGSVSDRDGPSRGPPGPGVLLHHPVPQQQFAEDMRHAPPPDNYRGSIRGGPSTSVSPPPHSRQRSPGSIPLASYASRGPVGPGQNPDASRPPYSYDPDVSRDHPFDRRRMPSEREWDEREQRRTSSNHPYPPPNFYGEPHGPPHAPSPAQSVRGRGRSPQGLRERSESARSPRAPHHRTSSGYWDPRQPQSAPQQGHHSYGRPSPPGSVNGMQTEPSGRRHDPRFDAHPREYERDIDMRSDSRSYAGSPDAQRAMRGPPPPHLMNGSMRGSESPHVGSMQAPDAKGRKRPAKDKDAESDTASKKDRKRRAPSKRVKEEASRAGSPKPPFSADGPPSQHHVHSFKVKPTGTPEPSSSSASRSNGSVQPSPTTAAPPSRVVDEDYDEGVADTLLGLSQYREQGAASATQVGPGTSGASARPTHSHRGSISSTVSHTSPPHHGVNLKRPMSPRSDETSDNKRARVEPAPRRRSSDGRTPGPSTRPSPIPFRQQPSQHNSPEERSMPLTMHPLDRTGTHSFAGSPRNAPLQVVLPPHPRPIGTGMSAHAQVSLPPMNPRSPSNQPSPAAEDDRMAVESRRSSQTGSPTSRGKFADMMHRPSSSPQGKAVPSPPDIVTLSEKPDSS